MKYDREKLIKSVAKEINYTCPVHFGLEIDEARCQRGTCKGCWEQTLEQILIPSEEETK